METSKIIAMLFSAFIGAGLGFLTQSYLSRLSFRQKTIESVVKRYLDARDEICELVAGCAVNSNPGDENWLKERRNSISFAYYKYFDYIPEEVIKELICLQACLKDGQNRLHKIDGRNLMLINEKDLEGFCKTISTLDNISHAIYYNMKHCSGYKRRENNIEYQARHALMNINKFFTEQNLTSLELFKPKSQTKKI